MQIKYVFILNSFFWVKKHKNENFELLRQRKDFGFGSIEYTVHTEKQETPSPLYAWHNMDKLRKAIKTGTFFPSWFDNYNTNVNIVNSVALKLSLNTGNKEGIYINKYSPQAYISDNIGFKLWHKTCNFGGVLSR